MVDFDQPGNFSRRPPLERWLLLRHGRSVHHRFADEVSNARRKGDVGGNQRRYGMAGDSRRDSIVVHFASGTSVAPSLFKAAYRCVNFLKRVFDHSSILRVTLNACLRCILPRIGICSMHSVTDGISHTAQRFQFGRKRTQFLAFQPSPAKQKLSHRSHEVFHRGVG